eukprot:COSAG01_NODE_64115_length_277_cov_1.808989_2_plen_42_part_01
MKAPHNPLSTHSGVCVAVVGGGVAGCAAGRAGGWLLSDRQSQ